MLLSTEVFLVIIISSYVEVEVVRTAGFCPFHLEDDFFFKSFCHESEFYDSTRVLNKCSQPKLKF